MLTCQYFQVKVNVQNSTQYLFLSVSLFSFTGCKTKFDITHTETIYSYAHIYIYTYVFVFKNDNACCKLSVIFTSMDSRVAGVGETHLLLCTLLHLLNFVMCGYIICLKQNFKKITEGKCKQQRHSGTLRIAITCAVGVVSYI